MKPAFSVLGSHSLNSALPKFEPRYVEFDPLQVVRCPRGPWQVARSTSALCFLRCRTAKNLYFSSWGCALAPPNRLWFLEYRQSNFGGAPCMDWPIERFLSLTAGLVLNPNPPSWASLCDRSFQPPCPSTCAIFLLALADRNRFLRFGRIFQRPWLQIFGPVQICSS